MSRYFPMFVSLENKKILVVGAGNIAVRRIKSLMEFGPLLRVVAPEINPELEDIIQKESGSENLRLECRPFEEKDLSDIDYAIIATDNKALNREIARLCRERGIPRNVSSDQSLCDFFFPSLVIEDDLTIGINSSGHSPAETKETRQQIEKMFGIKDSIYNRTNK